jgi:hypothetical protein
VPFECRFQPDYQICQLCLVSGPAGTDELEQRKPANRGYDAIAGALEVGIAFIKSGSKDGRWEDREQVSRRRKPRALKTALNAPGHPPSEMAGRAADIWVSLVGSERVRRHPHRRA